ncbi:MAG: ABC transporter ATP-binding protein [Nanoarchaeota archaeon]
MKHPLLKIENISLTYRGKNKNGVHALDNVNAEIYTGEFVSIIGPSGCGKTSLLSLISGIRKPSSGRIIYKDREVILPSRERVIIFQNYVLFPWKTAIQNIEIVLKSRNFDKKKITSEAERYLKLVNLSKFKNMYPSKLSCGMQQRIGIARALAADPEILLLDEPFASLDPINRNLVQEELLSMVRKLKKTMILVTHSIEEAVFLGDKILVMSNSPGKIIKKININFKKQNNILKFKEHNQFVDIKNKIHEILIREYEQKGKF